MDGGYDEQVYGVMSRLRRSRSELSPINVRPLQTLVQRMNADSTEDRSQAYLWEAVSGFSVRWENLESHCSSTWWKVLLFDLRRNDMVRRNKAAHLLGSGQSSFCEFPVAVFSIAANGHSCSNRESTGSEVQLYAAAVLFMKPDYKWIQINLIKPMFVEGYHGDIKGPQKSA